MPTKPHNSPLKPKPNSIQKRFIVLQAATLMVVFWLFAVAGYFVFWVQHEVGAPLGNLSHALLVAADVEQAMEELKIAAIELYDSESQQGSAALRAAAERLEQLRRQYAQIFLTGEEQDLALQVFHSTGQVVELAREFEESASRAHSQHRALRTMIQRHAEVQEYLHRIHALQITRALASYRRVRRAMLWLGGLMGVAVAFAVGMIGLFRRLHRRLIWQPLETLRQMVLQMRQGRLDLHGPVPDAVELEPLFRAFYQMTAELREMHGALEQKVLERTAQLEQAHQQLVRAAKLSALGQVVSGVAHEVNNPLTVILGFSEVALMRDDLPPRLRAHLEAIRAESLRLKNVVTNLLRFSQQQESHRSRIDLRDVIARLIQLRNYQLRVHGIRLHYEPPPQPVFVRGDAEQLLQALFNLMLNAEQAIRQRRAEGDIWLRCSAEAGCVVVAVQDNGVGIPPELREHVFEPLFTSKPLGRGTGLGLTVAWEIIRQHHGEIRLESEPGQGSTFSIVLPEDPQPAAADDPPAEPAAASASAPGLALVLDDEPAIAALLEHLLGACGWQTLVRHSADRFEAELRNVTPDLVLCDLKMPGRTGLDVLNWLRQHRPALAARFILMTGDPTDVENHAEELARIPILLKPFTVQTLLEALRQIGCTSVPSR
ncbi:MAG: response regulator [Firmicutes bacterium]|nr:response regulator [Bacillota bacterium]